MNHAKGNGLTADNSQPAKTYKQSTNDPIVAPAANLGKQLATLTAQFALKGHAVHKGNEDDFIVTRWGMSRYCQDLTELQSFARQLGVNK